MSNRGTKMTIDETVMKIKIDEDEELEVDKFIPYGSEPKYFAVVGEDLYYQNNNKYALLRSNYKSRELK